MKHFLSILFSLCFFASCKKASENPVAGPDPVTGEPVKTGSFTVQFQMVNGSNPFIFEKDYTNAAGELYRINLFKFYLSNIILTKPDGSKYFLPDSYFLVNPAVNQNIKFDNVPQGTYSKIDFTIGVDSSHNVSGVQKGALDPVNASDMFWSWKTGYVFLMMNGTSPASKVSGNNFEYHISGFKKEDYALQIVSSPFGLVNMDIRQNAVPNMHYYVDISEFFKNPAIISIAQYPIVTTPGSDAAMISANYKDMFIFQHVEN